MSKLRLSLIYIGAGLSLPAFLVAAVLILPEPYSNPIIGFATAPSEWIPLLKDKDTLHQLTLMVFRRPTPNYAPILMVFLSLFWFTTEVIVLLFARVLRKKLKARAYR